MKHCRCPNNIETLGIDVCASIRSVSFPTIREQKFKSLEIDPCDKPLEKELGGDDTRVVINNTTVPKHHKIIRDLFQSDIFLSFKVGVPIEKTFCEENDRSLPPPSRV